MFSQHGCLALLLALVNVTACLAGEDPATKRTQRSTPRDYLFQERSDTGRDGSWRHSSSAREAREVTQRDLRSSATERNQRDEQRSQPRDGSDRTSRGRS